MSSLVWYDPDPPPVAGVPIKIKKQPRVREATVGEDGTYRLCGLPEKYEGKLQAQRKDGGTTAEVNVTQDGGMLALRSMSVAPLVVAAAPGDTTKGAVARVAKGTARVLGRVLNKAGAPVEGARVSLLGGGGASTTTRPSGDFVLDSLPAGTQAISVRHLGYAPKEVPVELSSRTPARVNVELGAYVPELTPVEVVSQMDQGLDRVGFTGRKRGAAGGYFITPQMIENRKAAQFTDLLTTAPGIRIQGTIGQSYITSTRTVGRQGCVTVYVDGSQWQQLQPGDLDSLRASRGGSGHRGVSCRRRHSRRVHDVGAGLRGRRHLDQVEHQPEDQVEMMLASPIVHDPFKFYLGRIELTGFGHRRHAQRAALGRP